VSWRPSDLLKTTAAFVRDALRATKQSSDHATIDSKLRALREAVSHSYPTADIDQMLEETRPGHGAEADPEVLERTNQT
jgi:hypothetical protein